ncbi:MAG TPA: glycoside hydrolase family 9 protein [Woeseiaceae bacterium]|nr:glycoside hydrolase family 9 protein [Woeseiaceae bacterium]
MAARPARSQVLWLLAFCAAAAEVRAGCAAGSGQVFLNQVGFTPGSPKFAVLATPAAEPVRWQLVDESGAVQTEGHSRVFGADPLAGLDVHHVDFSGYDEPGAGYVLETECGTSHAFDLAPQLFDTLPYDALAYFFHNRSGMPIEAEYAGSAKLARPAAHERELVACVSGKDSHGNDWPGCDYKLDVSGGWYDAGDHGKYVVNGGIAVWTLMNVYERQRALGRRDPFGDGQAAIPEAGNGVNDLLDEVRYEMEFLLAMQAPADAVARVPIGVRRNTAGIEFARIDAAGMAHHKVADRNWTALPTPPHLDDEERVLHPVSTAATLNLAATAAQCARVWRGIDDAFAGRCLAAAETAWAAAGRNPEVYFIADFTGSGMYGDGDVSDEFFWAAAELYTTTGKAAYADFLRGSPWFDAPIEREPAWPFTAPAGVITLAIVDNELGSAQVAQLRERIVAAADSFRRESDRTGFRIPFASDRWAWGSNSTLLNRALLLALAHDFTGEDGYRTGVVDVLDYLLGRNPLEQSFISGYGERAMTNPHHRYWVPSADAGLPAPPPGALSGGPNNTAMIDPVAQQLKGRCAPLTCWRDEVEAYALNEVAINWNAPLVWVAAWLNEQVPSEAER